MSPLARLGDRIRQWRAPTPPPDAPTLVIVGAGASGLATTALARRAGLATDVIDQAERPGSRWRVRPDALRLNTVRWMSDLPGLRMPSSAGRWPDRGAYARYLEDYARWHGIVVHRGVAARRIDVGDDGVVVRLADGSTRRGTAAVVTTGRSADPVVPAWPGADRFPRTVLHAAAYRRPDSVPAGRGFVVGAGSSGGEIVLDLLSAGREVVWSVRSAPHVFPREVAGIPTTPFGALADRLPRSWVERGAALVERLIHRPRDYLPAPPAGPYALLRRCKEPLTADGIVAAIRARRVLVVPAVRALGPAGVRLVDGSLVEADHVVAATGFRPGLEELVGHLGVLDGDGHPVAAVPLPRLGFVGYRTPLGGTLWAIERDAREVVVALAARSRPAIART
jgi:putative flavoprotein involved in K+ transport